MGVPYCPTTFPQPDGTQSYNRYAYVNNNPMTFTDPSGFAALGDGPVDFSVDDFSLDTDFELPPQEVFGCKICEIWGTQTGHVLWPYGPPGMEMDHLIDASIPQSSYLPTKTQKTQNTKGKFTVFKGTPPGAKQCSAYGIPFLAPASFDPATIAAAGRAGGWSPFAMNTAVGHFGNFDFQRSLDSFGNTTFYTQYQFASNVAVGSYLFGTGIPEIFSNAIEDIFAFFNSSNVGSSVPTLGE